MNKEALDNFKELSQVRGKVIFAENLRDSSLNKYLSIETTQP
jgi:hypothetical protein